MGAAPCFFAVEADSPDHPKVLAVARDLGLPPIYAWAHIAAVWCWARQEAPDGSPLRREWLELKARWTGVQGAFYKAALAHGLIEETDRGVVIHGWQERQKKLVSLEAKRAADRERLRRWREQQKQALTLIPSPEPETAPADRNADETRFVPMSFSLSSYDLSGQNKSTSHAKEATPMHEVFSYYAGKRGGSIKLTHARRQLIERRLAEKWTVDQLKAAIDGCFKTPFNLGENDTGTKYLSLELILRGAEQIERFIEHSTNPPRSKNAPPPAPPRMKKIVWD